MTSERDPVLCYVQEPWAYFTTQPLEKQWGDDWNDAPYEHNAGRPYSPCWHREKGPCDCQMCQADWDGAAPRWCISKIAYTGDFSTPSTDTFNSPYSVQDINQRAIPWLRPAKGHEPIWAGTSLRDFVRLVKQAGGQVYVPME